MKKSVKYILGIGGLGVLFLVGSVIEARESRATGAYSTPVTVLNTSANAVPNLDAERAARIPYASSVRVTNCSSSLCQIFFTAPPAGYRLVVENVAGVFKLLPGTTTQPLGVFYAGTFSHGTWGFPMPIGPASGSDPVAGFNEKILGYVDPADGAPLFGPYGNFDPAASQTATLTGYLENCAVTGCPAVQH